MARRAPADRKLEGTERGRPRAAWTTVAILVGILGLACVESQSSAKIRPDPAQRGVRWPKGGRHRDDPGQRTTGGPYAGSSEGIDSFQKGGCSHAKAPRREDTPRTAVAAMGGGGQGILPPAEEGVRVGHPEAGRGHGGDGRHRKGSSGQGYAACRTWLAFGAHGDGSAHGRCQLGCARRGRSGAWRVRSRFLSGGVGCIQSPTASYLLHSGGCPSSTDSTGTSSAAPPQCWRTCWLPGWRTSSPTGPHCGDALHGTGSERRRRPDAGWPGCWDGTAHFGPDDPGVRSLDSHKDRRSSPLHPGQRHHADPKAVRENVKDATKTPPGKLSPGKGLQAKLEAKRAADPLSGAALQPFRMSAVEGVAPLPTGTQTVQEVPPVPVPTPPPSSGPGTQIDLEMDLQDGTRSPGLDGLG